MDANLCCLITNANFLSPQIYPCLLEQPRPCLSAQGGRGEGGGRQGAGKVFLREIFISIRPHPNPNAFPSVVDLSATVFRDQPFKKPKPSKKETKTWSLPSLSEEQTSGSQLVVKLSLVKTISPVPRCPPLSNEEREGTFQEVWEASRLTPGRLFIFCTKLTDCNNVGFQGFS